MQAPCVNCNNKGCGSYHDHCPEYLKFKEKRDAMLAENMKEADLYTALYKEIRGKRSLGRLRKHKNSYKK